MMFWCVKVLTAKPDGLEYISAHIWEEEKQIYTHELMHLHFHVHPHTHDIYKDFKNYLSVMIAAP